MTERALAAQRSQQVRIFRKFETLVTYLKGVGIARFEVDAVNYDAASLKLTRTRPDSAEAMKKRMRLWLMTNGLEGKCRKQLTTQGHQFHINK